MCDEHAVNYIDNLEGEGQLVKDICLVNHLPTTPKRAESSLPAQWEGGPNRLLQKDLNVLIKQDPHKKNLFLFEMDYQPKFWNLRHLGVLSSSQTLEEARWLCVLVIDGDFLIFVLQTVTAFGLILAQRQGVIHSSETCRGTQ